MVIINALIISNAFCERRVCFSFHEINVLKGEYVDLAFSAVLISGKKNYVFDKIEVLIFTRDAVVIAYLLSEKIRKTRMFHEKSGSWKLFFRWKFIISFTPTSSHIVKCDRYVVPKKVVQIWILLKMYTLYRWVGTWKRSNSKRHNIAGVIISDNSKFNEPYKNKMLIVHSKQGTRTNERKKIDEWTTQELFLLFVSRALEHWQGNLEKVTRSPLAYFIACNRQWHLCCIFYSEFYIGLHFALLDHFAGKMKWVNKMSRRTHSLTTHKSHILFD